MVCMFEVIFFFNVIVVFVIDIENQRKCIKFIVLVGIVDFLFFLVFVLGDLFWMNLKLFFLYIEFFVKVDIL